MDDFKRAGLKRSRMDTYYNDGVNPYSGKKRKIVSRVARSKIKSYLYKQTEQGEE